MKPEENERERPEESKRKQKRRREKPEDKNGVVDATEVGVVEHGDIEGKGYRGEQCKA